MPITQDRLITAINGMVELRGALTEVHSWLIANRSRSETSSEVDYTIARMAQLMSEIFTRYDPTILVELHYYRVNRDRNIRARDKMRDLRRNTGIKPRKQYKPAFNTTDELKYKGIDTPNTLEQMDFSPSQTRLEEIMAQVHGSTYKASDEEIQAYLREQGEVSEAMKKPRITPVSESARINPDGTLDQREDEEYPEPEENEE